jgi:hypothetical protein
MRFFGLRCNAVIALILLRRNSGKYFGELSHGLWRFDIRLQSVAIRRVPDRQFESRECRHHDENHCLAFGGAA